MSLTETAPLVAPVSLDTDVVASVQDLHVSFRSADGIVRALRGVDLDIRAGEVVALVGESGSGKSVLGMSLLGLLSASGRPETSGSVEVAGVDMLHGPDRTRRRVRQELLGAVFQDPLTSLNPTMRVGKQLLERGIAKDRAVRQLGEAGVPDPQGRMRQYPHQLSGGLRQRVMIAMALGGRGIAPETEDGAKRPRLGWLRRGGRRAANGVVVDLDDGDLDAGDLDPGKLDAGDLDPGELDAGDLGARELAATDGATALDLPVAVAHGDDGAPRLIVADEPTTALDVSVQAQVVLLFDRLRREHGCAVLLVTHDLGVAASIADRIVVLYAGRVCETGPAASVLEEPAHPYTKALLAARLSVDGTTAGNDPMPGEPPNPLSLPPGCAFAPRCSHVEADCEVAPPEPSARLHGRLGGVACLHQLAPPGDHLLDDHQRDDHQRGEKSAGTPLSISVHESSVPVTMQPASSRPTVGGIALELAGVSKAFDVGGRGADSRLVAVDDLSLRVPVRGSVALVGESGCGKTTTLRMATGLLQPDTGSVGWAPGGGRPQLVFQDAGSSLTPWMAIGLQVEERLRVLGIGKAERERKALEYLGRVGLDTRAARSKPRDLSGGQRQRAVIARALASEPKLLVCDEPVSALDASLAVRVLTLLESLRDDLGVALLVVTHDLAAARRIADEVAVMYLGKIVEQAPAGKLFAHPDHPYTRGLIDASPTTEPGRLSPTLAGEPPSAVGRKLGCAFAPRCPRVTEVCREQAPEYRRLADGNSVACHHA